MNLSFSEYQKRASTTAVYPNVGHNYIYPTLGLCGEAGEVAEKIKKVIRDNNGFVSNDATSDIVNEIGDIMWYIAQLCTELNISLEAVALNNLKKLAKRKDNGTLKGSGDNR